MLDVISGGRLVAGLPVGTSMDTNFAYGTIPAETRERYDEAHRLIRRAWAEPEPFAFNGRYTKLRNARRLGMAGKILFPIPERGLAERLYRVRARRVLVWGESDRMIPPAYAEAWGRALPDARLVRVPEAGHMLPYEKPDAVLGALARLA
jgi:pimeloyl-ACP methyl ester carboxylesterase